MDDHNTVSIAETGKAKFVKTTEIMYNMSGSFETSR